MANHNTVLNKIHSLATFIRDRRENGEPPYVLLLGAGASLASGASSTTQVIENVVQEHKGQNPTKLSWEENLIGFCETLDKVSAGERYNILSRHLKGIEPSDGYHHLAALVKMGCFDLILTTNFDLFLENALMDAGMRAQEFMVLINSQDQEQQIIKSLNYPTPRVKILKLHGDLNARLFAFTPEEIFQFTDKIERALTDLLNGDLLVVGHSLRDDDLNRCIRANGGALWYVNPNEPSVADYAGRAIRARGTADHFISGEEGKFDSFFAWLCLELILPVWGAYPQEHVLLNEWDGHRKNGDQLGMAESLQALAELYAQTGEKERAELCYDRSAALLESCGDQQNAAYVYRALGTFHAHLNRPEQALLCYRRSRDLSRAANDSQGLAASLAMIGQWWRAAHKLEKAISYWEEALKISGGMSDLERERVSRWLKEARQELNDD